MFGVELVTGSAALVLIFLLGVWALALKLTQGSGSLTVRGMVFPQEQVLLVLSACTVLIIWGVLASLVGKTILFSAFVAGSHALLRDETSLPTIIDDHSSTEESNDENSKLLKTDKASEKGAYAALLRV